MSFLTTPGGDDISLHPAPLVYVASGTVSLFLHVFSDYTGGDDILLPLRKELVVLAAGHRNQRHASQEVLTMFILCLLTDRLIAF